MVPQPSLWLESPGLLVKHPHEGLTPSPLRVRVSVCMCGPWVSGCQAVCARVHSFSGLRVLSTGKKPSLSVALSWQLPGPVLSALHGDERRCREVISMAA